jgi:proline iminopeptidase
MGRLKSELPPGVLKVMEKHEAEGEYEDHEYEKAVMVYYRRHLLRRKKWPPEQNYTMKHMSKLVYGTMNGPNEFTIIGNLRYWDITDQLHKIKVPTLVTGGKYDEVTPTVAKSIHDHIKGSRLVTFQKSSHLAMWEERPRYMETLDQFIRSVSD